MTFIATLFEGRRAIVMGGTSGIGAGTALRLPALGDTLAVNVIAREPRAARRVTSAERLVNGGFAPYVAIPARNVHPVHASVGEHAGALYEPLACVANCLRPTSTHRRRCLLRRLMTSDATSCQCRYDRDVTMQLLQR